MAPSIDASSFIMDQVRKAKTAMEEAAARGDYAAAARHARKAAVLLRRLAELRPWSRERLEELAGEYERLAEEYSGVRPRLSRALRARGETVGDTSGEGEDEFYSRALELIVRADVSWDDIVGLEEAKKSLIEAILYSMARPSDGRVRFEPPRRILLYGPPGTGKTMLGMAASRMMGATFFYVSVDKILSKYVGDSPRMLAAVFRAAESMAPSIVFFDEVEALAASRDSGREPATGLVQTFLTELDGFKSKMLDKPVLVIAATNKPWLLDEAILSRFEKKIYTPLPDVEARMKLFQLEIERKGFQISGITYRELAEMTEGYSGREIRTAARQAVVYMLRRANPDLYEKAFKLSDPSMLSSLTYKVEPLTRDDLLRAIRAVKPSVTRDEIRRYEEWARTHGG